MEGYKDLSAIYSGKKVFLTGHTGFKGSWLLSWLHILGAEIKGYALAPENINNLYNSIEGEKISRSVIADIRDRERVKEEILAYQPDFVFHLAAQPLVRQSYQTPLDTFDINVMGTANVLDALRYLEKPCALVIITTDKVYENKEWIYPYREVDNLGGYDPYSASKACSELVVDSYRNSFFNILGYNKHKKAIATARAGNVIGGGDWSQDRIIPDIIRALSSNESIHVRNPLAIRPWQHVLEPLYGYLLLGAQLAEDPTKYSGAYNFGPYTEDTLSVEDLVKIAVDLWGAGNYHKSNAADQPHEAGILKLDINKANKELNWRPKLTSDKAISWTIDWYKQTNKATIREFTLGQINDYSKLQ
ncbi:MAG: CDP-glucose 4,6-dehydratase [Mucilaginibacter sp.]|nr:CDP-glucose 4,6-dehydratase [Mucilaginibacter sp.]